MLFSFIIFLRGDVALVTDCPVWTEQTQNFTFEEKKSGKNLFFRYHVEGQLHEFEHAELPTANAIRP